MAYNFKCDLKNVINVSIEQKFHCNVPDQVAYEYKSLLNMQDTFQFTNLSIIKYKS